MYPGRPCQFVNIGGGCTIYKDRPKEPCKTYQCLWLVDESIPEYLKPTNSNVILTSVQVDGIEYVELLPTGKEVHEDILTWFILWGLERGLNLLWQNVHRYSSYLGTPQYIEAISNHLKGGPLIQATSE